LRLIDAGIAPVLRLMQRGQMPVCFICKDRILPSEERLRLRGDTFVHRRCATYRLRTRRSKPSRLGFPG
jgi:hypothetical protein